MNNQTFTITFGDQAENHVGMCKIGQAATEGFNYDDLIKAKSCYEQNGAKCDLLDLKMLLPEELKPTADNAWLLVVHGGLNTMIKPYNSDDFFNEQNVLQKDTKAFMYGRVVNKTARHNLCFGFENQEPNYEQGQGRVIAFNNVPLLNHIRQVFPLVIGNKGEGLVAEGNYYYDISKTGIGAHGDSERRKAIGIRVGANLPLQYHWFYQNKPVGITGEIILEHGDIYFMSEKAVGTDWKKKNILTLRHAAGAQKYLGFKEKVKK